MKKAVLVIAVALATVSFSYAQEVGIRFGNVSGGKIERHFIVNFRHGTVDDGRVYIYLLNEVRILIVVVGHTDVKLTRTITNLGLKRFQVFWLQIRVGSTECYIFS